MTKQHRSGAMASIHRPPKAFTPPARWTGQTMRRFDDACLTPVHPLTAQEIWAAAAARGRQPSRVRPLSRKRDQGPVSQWECGEKRPHGASLLKAARPGGPERITCRCLIEPRYQ